LKAAEGRIELTRHELAVSLNDQRSGGAEDARRKALRRLSEPANAEEKSELHDWKRPRGCWLCARCGAEEGGWARPAASGCSANAPSAETVDQGCPVCGDEGGDSAYYPGRNGRCPMCLRTDTGYRRTSEGLHPRNPSPDDAPSAEADLEADVSVSGQPTTEGGRPPRVKVR
jgi:hypothetical protein